jgi:hypothetical protein
VGRHKRLIEASKPSEASNVLKADEPSKPSRPSNVSESEWTSAIETFKELGELDQESFRKKGKKLVAALEREGREAHRDADRLENLSAFSKVKAEAVRPSEHSRSKTLARLEQTPEREPPRGFTALHLHLVRFQMDRLADTDLNKPGELRRQAALLLDAAEFLDDTINAHKRKLDELYARRSPNGPRPSVMMERIVDMMLYWDMAPTNTFRLLSAEGVPLISIASLAMRLKRRRDQPPPNETT